ncbi:hypothetical protein [Borreliella turdi]|uniref:hypothetical protein n=1 Tax=Borreliella turdi TaxID=57863 RepID=UPI001F478E06|nr:hypothetical protein [Borreliella turdi]
MIKNEFEEIKNFIKEDLRKTTSLINPANKDNLALEIKNILSRERIKIQALLKEEIEKYFNPVNLGKINE